MSLPASVYRTTDAETVAAFKAAGELRASWGNRVVAFAESIVDGGKALTSYGFGSEHFVGIKFVHGDKIPDGWRVHVSKRGWDYLVPRRSTKAGKAIAKEFDALGNAPSARAALMSMPDGFLGGDGEGIGIAYHSPGAALDGDVLTVVWGVVLPEAQEANVGAQWERVPLSVYYAEREAVEAAS